MASLPLIQDVVIELLQDAFPDALIDSWVPNVDFRTYPIINVRRIGGARHETRPKQLGLPVVELTVYGNVGVDKTHELYEDVLDVLYDAVQKQTQTAHGYLHSIKETMGATQFDSPMTDTWRVQGLIQFGLRPLRN